MMTRMSGTVLLLFSAGLTVCLSDTPPQCDNEPPNAPGAVVAAEQIATFACGCFWGTQLRFDRVPGVLRTRVGYTGGHSPDPTYMDVIRSNTGHAEAVEVAFDPSAVAFEDLLEVFWEWHDPTTLNRQGNDVGTQYRSAIFTHGEQQYRQALESMQMHAAGYAAPIVTEIRPASVFYPAETYHQKYLEVRGQDASTGATEKIRCYG